MRIQIGAAAMMGFWTIAESIMLASGDAIMR